MYNRREIAILAIFECDMQGWTCRDALNECCAVHEIDTG